MDTEKLTEKVIDLLEMMRSIEGQTKRIPKMEEKLDDMCMSVHDNTTFRLEARPLLDDIKKNTEFRKAFEKIKWFSISAIIMSLIAFIMAFIAKFTGGG